MPLIYNEYNLSSVSRFMGVKLFYCPSLLPCNGFEIYKRIKKEKHQMNEHLVLLFRLAKYLQLGK